MDRLPVAVRRPPGPEHRAEAAGQGRSVKALLFAASSWKRLTGNLALLLRLGESLHVGLHAVLAAVLKDKRYGRVLQGSIGPAEYARMHPS